MTNTSQSSNTFLLGETVSINLNMGSVQYGIIRAKLKNVDAYAVSFPASVASLAANQFGLPIRHIELLWGKWTGKDNEFVVPAHELHR